MHIVTFTVVLLASLGALYAGAKAFAMSFAFLTKVFQRAGLFIWNNFAVSAVRFVQAVITERAAMAQKAEVAVEHEVTHTRKITGQRSDWDHLEIPTYLRKGKELVW